MLFGLLRNRTRSKGGAASRGFLMRLLRSKRAATLPIVAASIFPMIGIIGGSVDMTRLYLVKAKLQQACDGAALAARRGMTTQTLTSTDRTRGQQFFDANLKVGVAGAYGSANVVLALTDVLNAQNVATGAVHGHATADVPMTLMRVLGQSTKTLAVDCEAQLNISNNDVLFVLDVTGSMSCLPSDSESTCDTYAGGHVVPFGSLWGTTEKASSRIDGLRGAVENFAATLSSATPTSARLRIGFLPYAENVSVGPIVYAANSSWMNANPTYYTKYASFSTTKSYFSTGSSNNVTQETYIGSTPTNITAPNCKLYGTNSSFTGFSPSPSGNNISGGGPQPADTTVTTYAAYSWGGSTNSSTWGTSTTTKKACIRTKTVTTTSWTPGYAFTGWSVGNKGYDTSTFVTGAPVSIATGLSAGAYTTVSGGQQYNLLQLAQGAAAGTIVGVSGTKNSTWDGCIVERATGTDDVTTAPTGTAATKWTPSWPDVVFNSGGSANPAPSTYGFHYACPKSVDGWGSLSTAGASHFLNTITASNLTEVGDYVNIESGVQTTSPSDFLALGFTYHDIGMMWAARLMAPSGLFSYEHTAAPNGKPVNRHIIFMTDGNMEPNSAAYTAYGIESSSETAHTNRFLAACQAAKDQGVSVWVVSFANGTLTGTDPLSQCANANQAFAASDSAQLNSMFQMIAQRIGDLRLTQ